MPEEYQSLSLGILPLGRLSRYRPYSQVERTPQWVSCLLVEGQRQQRLLLGKWVRGIEEGVLKNRNCKIGVSQIYVCDVTGRDELFPFLVIYASIMDSDWAFFVKDNHNNRSLLGSTEHNAS